MSINLANDIRKYFCLAGIAAGAWMVGPAWGGEPRGPEKGPEPSVFERYGKLAEYAGELDWEAEHQLLTQAIDNVWEANGWDDEANQFAQTLARDVAAIPPWNLMGRFDLMSQRVSERYRFSPNQESYFRQAVMRETGGLLMRHAGMIFDQSVEILRIRGSKQPFTAEQAARWTKESEEFFREARESTDRMVKDLTSRLRPEQKKILEQDVAAFEKRWQVVEQMRGRWARGKWSPDDWGLQDDPIQKRATELNRRRPTRGVRRVDRNRVPERRSRPKRWVAHDPATWIAYVRDFERRYRLDAGQATAVRSIHAELFERATAYAESRAEELKTVPRTERAAHELYEPICGYFLELETRLEVIPTSSQRDQNER